MEMNLTPKYAYSSLINQTKLEGNFEGRIKQVSRQFFLITS